jgi:hypothetical protein
LSALALDCPGSETAGHDLQAKAGSATEVLVGGQVVYERKPDPA